MSVFKKRSSSVRKVLITALKVHLLTKNIVIRFRYRLKCRKYEKRLEESSVIHKNKEVELAKESARAKEIEIANLKLQKEQQELLYELEHIKQELDEREQRMSFLSEEKHHVEHALSQASTSAKQTAELKVGFHHVLFSSVQRNV